MPTVQTPGGHHRIAHAALRPFLKLGKPGAPEQGRERYRKISGWAVNPIVTAQSGMPVAITQATNNNSFAGFALQRPNQIAKPNFSPQQRSPGQFFNTAAFATAPQFTIGDASRNPVRGPAFRDLDLSLIKRTDLGEKTRLEFRAELFNATNTPAFAQPNGSFGSAAFGSITATTAEERVAQFALRLMR